MLVSIYSLGILAGSSLLLALVLTPLCRHVLERWGVVDRPDGGRHRHAHPVPRAGGIPILAAYFGAFAALALASRQGERSLLAGMPPIWKLAPAVTLVFTLGLLDDVRGLKPWQKFAGEILAASMAYWAEMQVTGIAFLTLPAWLSFPLTVLWLVGCCNAFNLIDGMDGLAAGAGLFATITLLLGGLVHRNVALALITVPLAGALLGFLRYNFSPASIFLGDSGSLTIGFLLGCYGVVWGQKSAAALGMTAPMIAVGVPLLDTAVSIARRFLRQRPIFLGDASHIHHRLLARGLPPRRVALLLYAACAVAAILSLVSSLAQDLAKGGILLLVCVLVWIGVQRLGYAEFGVMARMVLHDAFRRHLNSALTLRTAEEKLARAETAEDCWCAVREACANFGFTHAELQVNGHHFEEVFEPARGNTTWDLDIPLPNQGYLHLERCFGEAKVPTVLVPFAEALRNSLARHQFCRSRQATPEEEPGLEAMVSARQEIQRAADQVVALGENNAVIPISSGPRDCPAILQFSKVSRR